MNSLKPVRPLGAQEPFDVLLLLVSCIAIGILAGLLAAGIGQFIWLIILFPIGMGFAVGMGATVVIKARKVRAPLIAMLCAGLGGLVAYSMDLTLDYVRTRAAVGGNLEEYAVTLKTDTGIQATDAAVSEAVDFLFDAWGAQREEPEVDAQMAAILIGEPITVGELPEQAPPPPVGTAAAVEGFVRMRINAGTSIGNAGSDGAPIGPIGTMILWFVELSFTVGFAAFAARAEASEPACGTCKNWYSEEVAATVLGAEPTKAAAGAALERGDVAALVEGLPVPDDQKRFAALMARHCPVCESAPVYVEANLLFLGPKGTESKTLKRGFIEPALYTQIVVAANASYPQPEVALEQG